MVRYENMLVFQDKLKHDEEYSKDSIVAAKTFEFADHDYTDWAHQQMAAKTKIPMKYYQRMREEQPALLVNNVDTWLKQEQDKKLLIRELDGKVRAVLSDRYLPLSNRLVCNTVALTFLDMKVPFDVLRQWVTDYGMYLTIVSPTKYDLDGKGDMVQLGMQLRNSEVGYSRLEARTFMYRHACKNGAIFGKDDIGGFTKVHLGQRMQTTGFIELSDTTKRLDIKTTVSAIRDITMQTFDPVSFEGIIERIRAGKSVAVEDKVGTVNLLKEQANLSDELEKLILAQFDESNQYGFANAITAAARQQKDEEKQIELEELGGKLLVLDENAFKKAFLVKEK